MEGHGNNNNPLRRIKVTVADEISTAVAGQKDTYTIVVTSSAPSDVTGAVTSDNFPDSFSGVNLYRDAGRWGASNRAQIAETDGSATFSFEIRLHKLPHAREMYESDARLRAALPQGAGIDFAIAD